MKNYFEEYQKAWAYLAQNDSLKATHRALFWAIFHKWNEAFFNPFNVRKEELMQLSGIASLATYFSTLEDLREIVKYEKGTSKHRPSTLEITVPNFSTVKSTVLKSSVLKNSTVKGSTVLKNSTVHIYSNTDIENTDNTNTDCEENKFSSPFKKEIVLKKISVVSMIRAEVEALKEGYYWTAKDAANAKQISEKIRFRFEKKYKRTATETEIIDSFLAVVTNLPEWYAKQWDVAFLNSHFEKIITEIQNANASNRNQKTNADSEQAAYFAAKFGDYTANAN